MADITRVVTLIFLGGLDGPGGQIIHILIFLNKIFISDKDKDKDLKADEEEEEEKEEERKTRCRDDRRRYHWFGLQRPCNL